MDKENKPEIKISDPYLDAMKAVKDEVGNLKNNVSWGMTFVIGILLIGFLTLLFMVAGLLLDGWRFNSSVYKEDTVMNLNSQIIKNNTDQQQQILNLLNKINSK